MRNANGAAVVLLVGACVACASRSGAARPLAEEGSSPVRTMTLALDDAWWLRISRDRDHAIGYGALPQRMAVAADAFAFDALVALLEPRAEPRGLGTTVGPECRFTVLFERTGGPEDSLSHALPADLCPTLRALFRRAWLGRQPDRSFAADATTVERFWRAAPFVVNRDSIPAHGDPDAR